MTAMVLLTAVTAVFLVMVPSPVSAQSGPDPVIIVAGTFAPAAVQEPLQNRLIDDGYDAYIFELPGLGIGDIAESSEALVPFVNAILAQTGATKVDLVGHSQGGLVSRYYVKYLGGDSTVDSLIALGAPNNGTALANIANAFGVDGICTSCEQMAIGSDFLADLNAGDDTIGSVSYTNIYSASDEIVFPARTARLGDGATNVRVQSRCWFRPVGHVGLLFDSAVYSGVEDALEHRRVRLSCW